MNGNGVTGGLWSPKEDSTLIHYRASGLSYTAISRLMGRSDGSCLRRHTILECALPTSHEAERQMLAQIIAEGGFPRADVIAGRTVWIGYDNRPWRGMAA